MSQKYKLAVLIGRYEPCHNAHFRNFAFAAEIAESIHIMLGSSYQPRTIKNPFTAQERKDMIYDSIMETPYGGPSIYRVQYSFIRDYIYNNNLWLAQVQKVIKEMYPTIEDKDICIVGHDKDESSWYLRAFPKWKVEQPGMYVQNGSKPLDATKIRELYFEGHLGYIQSAVPRHVFNFLEKFSATEHYKTLVQEHNFIKDYKKRWEAAPFPPTFFTADAVVVQSGHILLVKRKRAPGKGLWALPGGFVKQTESAKDGCIRELKEETRLKVPEVVLRKGITFNRLFDAPNRSLRGRTITEAFLIELDGGDGTLPKTRANDDAEEAEWFTLAAAKEMSEYLFEDHHSIIEMMIGRAE